MAIETPDVTAPADAPASAPAAAQDDPLDTDIPGDSDALSEEFGGEKVIVLGKSGTSLVRVVGSMMMIACASDNSLEGAGAAEIRSESGNDPARRRFLSGESREE